MDWLIPIPTLHEKLAGMSGGDSKEITAMAVSKCQDTEHMDGQMILASFDKRYARSWTYCISIDKLNKDSLPPFFVRLRDDQIGHLWVWTNSIKNSLTRSQPHQHWPWDFTCNQITKSRDPWRPPHHHN